MIESRRLPFLLTILIISIMVFVQTIHAETLVLSPADGSTKSKHPITSPLKQKKPKLHYSKKPLPVMDGHTSQKQ